MGSAYPTIAADAAARYQVTPPSHATVISHPEQRQCNACQHVWLVCAASPMQGGQVCDRDRRAW